MESQYSISLNSEVQSLDLTDVTFEFIYDKITQIYHEIKSYKEDDPAVVFNINVSFISKINRYDKLFKQAWKIKNLKSFILNNIELTEKELKAITLAYMTLKENLALKKNQIESVETTLKTATSHQVLYKAFSAAAYYTEFHLNKEIETNFGLFKITSIIESNQGLRALYLEPIGENSMITSPILSIRGTVYGNAANAYDDLHSSIGSIGFQSAKDQILILLAKSLMKFPKGCCLIGHSLGGAIAQQIAAAFAKGGLISEVVYFNSPGVGSLVAKQFMEDCNLLPIPPQVIEVRHECDLLSYFGGRHLPLSKRLIIKDNEVVSYQAAHEILRLMEKCNQNLLDVEEVDSPKELGFWKGKYNYFTVETLRWSFAPLLRLLVSWNFTSETKPQVEEIESEEISVEEYFVKTNQL